jgi:ferredoxin
VCGSCKVRVCAGTVEPGAALALSEQERADGDVLACVARPASDATGRDEKSSWVAVP